MNITIKRAVSVRCQIFRPDRVVQRIFVLLMFSQQLMGGVLVGVSPTSDGIERVIKGKLWRYANNKNDMTTNLRYISDH